MAIPKNYKEFCLDYLYSYSDISAIKTNRELDKKVNNLSKEVIKIIPYNEITLLTKNELQLYKDKNFVDCVCCTDCGGSTKPIALLRHLRNAIAHGNLNQNGKYFVLEDWDNNNKTNLTAIGKFDKVRIKKILELFA